MKNLITRALTGIIFVGVLVGAIYFHSIYFLIVFGIITGLTLWELCGLIKIGENNIVTRGINTLGGVYLFVASYLFTNGITGGNIFLPYLLFLMYLFVSELYTKANDPIRNWGNAMFAQFYCAGSFSMMNFLLAPRITSGQNLPVTLFLLSIFIIIWLNDTGAYLIGSTFGKHRLFERISPKKSWEGFFGGLVVSLLFSYVIYLFAPEIPFYKWILFSFIVVISGTFGDLAESLLKRTLQVKDSGNLLPGHGGMLDRFDSVMLAVPAAYIYIEYVIIQN